MTGPVVKILLRMLHRVCLKVCERKAALAGLPINALTFRVMCITQHHATVAVEVETVLRDKPEHDLLLTTSSLELMARITVDLRVVKL
jgi:hypothetical protein